MNKQDKSTTRQNRIIGHGEKCAKEFVFNTDSWKDHPASHKTALNEILTKIGWVTGVIVSLVSGKLIDGHARIEETLARDPEQLAPFTEVDLSPDEEKTMLALFDPLGHLAVTDTERLGELVASLGLESNRLLGVFEGMINFPDDLAAGDDVPNLSDPGFNYQNRFGVIVECADEPEQARIYEKLRADGYSVKVVV